MLDKEKQILNNALNSLKAALDILNRQKRAELGYSTANIMISVFDMQRIISTQNLEELSLKDLKSYYNNYIAKRDKLSGDLTYHRLSFAFSLTDALENCQAISNLVQELIGLIKLDKTSKKLVNLKEEQPFDTFSDVKILCDQNICPNIAGKHLFEQFLQANLISNRIISEIRNQLLIVRGISITQLVRSFTAVSSLVKEQLLKNSAATTAASNDNSSGIKTKILSIMDQFLVKIDSLDLSLDKAQKELGGLSLQLVKYEKLVLAIMAKPSVTATLPAKVSLASSVAVSRPQMKSIAPMTSSKCSNGRIAFSTKGKVAMSFRSSGINTPTRKPTGMVNVKSTPVKIAKAKSVNRVRY